MKPSTDIIAAALDAALSPRPLNYTIAGLAAAIAHALAAEGYSILPGWNADIDQAPKDGTEVMIAYVVRDSVDGDYLNVTSAIWTAFRDSDGNQMAGTWLDRDGYVYPTATHWQPVPGSPPMPKEAP